MLSLYYQMISFLEMDFHQAAYNLYNIDSNLHTMNSMVYCDYMAPQKLEKSIHMCILYKCEIETIKMLNLRVCDFLMSSINGWMGD